MASRTIKSAFSTSAATRPLNRTLEIERKFVPTKTLQQHVRKSATTESFTSFPTTPNPSATTFTRLPRTRITDKYFSHPSDSLADCGIWIRYRRVAPLTPLFHAPGTSDCKGVWQAKVRRAGDYTNSYMLEVEGKAEVNAVIRDAGAGGSVFDLVFWIGFVCERTAWTVQAQKGDRKGGQGLGEGVTVCVDTVIAKLEGREGERGVHWRHQVGEVEVSKSVLASASHMPESVEDHATLTNRLKAFMAQHPNLFAGEGEPVGKLSALVAHERDVKERLWRVNEPGRIASMAEVAWDRMMAREEGR